VCDDGDPCTNQICSVPDGGCIETINDCTLCEVSPGVPVDCGTSNDKCDIIFCDLATGLCETDTVECDDNNPCTNDDCDPSTGTCVYVPISCPAIACSTVTCNPSTGQCDYVDVNCDDNSVCTTDSCNSGTGECEYVTVTCNDDDVCTTDTCDPVDGCQFTHVDGNNGADYCDDLSVCTLDYCDPNDGCINELHFAMTDYIVHLISVILFLVAISFL
jgi:hypothetical protein